MIYSYHLCGRTPNKTDLVEADLVGAAVVEHQWPVISGQWSVNSDQWIGVHRRTPTAEPDDLREALRYAAEAVRERELPLVKTA